MIALGASQIAIVGDQPFLKYLPHVLRKRVTVVEKHLKSFTQAKSLIAPIEEEFGIEYDGVGVAIGKGEIPERLKLPILRIFDQLLSFLVAVNNELVVDLHLGTMKSDIRSLRQLSSNPHSRSYLAVVEGALQTYEMASFPIIGFRSFADQDTTSLFEEFLEDTEYIELSRNVRKIGFSKHARCAITKAKRNIYRLIRKTKFKALIDTTLSTISHTTSLPLPDSEQAEIWIKKGYYPPFFPIVREILRQEN